MAEYTENLNLILPKKTETYDVETANTNNKIIDVAINSKMNAVPGKGLSTNDFTNAYKKKIDSMQRLYKFKGSITTYNDLNTIAEKTVGDVYNILDTNNNYCWDGIQWVELGINIDLSGFINENDLNNSIDILKIEIQQNIQNQIIEDRKTIFPVGSTYITQEDVNPLEILGFGTWERFSGLVAVGLDEDVEEFNEIGKKVGEVRHKLTKAELPAEAVLVELKSQQFQSGTGSWGATYNSNESNINTKLLGEGQAISMLQPTQVVGYMWIRRA